MPGRIKSEVNKNTLLAREMVYDLVNVDELRDVHFDNFTRANQANLDLVPLDGRRSGILLAALDYRISSFPYIPNALERGVHFRSNPGAVPSERGSFWNYGVINAPRLGTGDVSGVTAWAINPDSNYLEDSCTWLWSPRFNFSTLSGSGYSLQFDLWMSAGPNDALKLQVSLDNDETWLDVITSEPYNVSDSLLDEYFGDNPDGWGDSLYAGLSVTPVTVPILPYEGLSSVRFRWAFASVRDSSFPGPVIDSIRIS